MNDRLTINVTPSQRVEFIVDDCAPMLRITAGETDITISDTPAMQQIALWCERNIAVLRVPTLVLETKMNLDGLVTGDA